MTLRICGVDIEVELSDPQMWAQNGMGRTDQLNGRILIRDGMPNSIYGVTLLHEVIHMIADMNGLALSNSETDVAVLSNALYAFLRDNPNVFKEKP